MKKRSLLVLSGIIFCLGIFACNQPTGNNNTEYVKTSIVYERTDSEKWMIHNIPYTGSSNERQVMDLFFSKNSSAGEDRLPIFKDVTEDRTKLPSDALLILHGEGWSLGNKESMEKYVQMVRENQEMLVFAMNYRYADGGTVRYSQILEDVALAVAKIQDKTATAWKLKSEGKKIGIMGYGAGGHLAMLYAYQNPDKIAFVVNVSGPTDFTDNEYLTIDTKVENDEFTKALLKQYRTILNKSELTKKQLIGHLLQKLTGDTFDFVDGNALPDTWKQASPLTWIRMEGAKVMAVPTLMVYGGRDPLILPSQATRLRDKLATVSVQYEEIVFPDSEHLIGIDPTDPNLQTVQEAEVKENLKTKINEYITNFF